MDADSASHCCSAAAHMLMSYTVDTNVSAVLVSTAIARTPHIELLAGDAYAMGYLD